MKRHAIAKHSLSTAAIPAQGFKEARTARRHYLDHEPTEKVLSLFFFTFAHLDIKVASL